MRVHLLFRTSLLVCLTATVLVADDDAFFESAVCGSWCGEASGPACNTCGEADPYGEHGLLDLKSCLGEHGISLDVDISQFYQGVADGGIEREFRYSGHGDYLMNISAEQLGGPQGLFVTLRAEHRFGETISGATGAFLPSNTLGDLPVADSEELYLTNVRFMQMFSESFGVFFGKVDTLDGDDNAFAHGRGKTQFMNAAFVVTPIGLRTVVYSTLGAGIVILHEGEPIFSFSVLNAKDTARTAGFDELFADGVALVPELRLPTEFFGLPGHQLFGATWSSRNFAALDQRLTSDVPNIALARESGSWSLYWNFDQFLYVDAEDPTRGWGVFGRSGIADPETNPIEWFLSFGVGGNSLLPGRKADTFGAGWFYSGTSDDIGPILATTLGGIGDGQGVELYYRAQLTDWFHLTGDIQFLDPARQSVASPTVVGLRGVLDF